MPVNNIAERTFSASVYAGRVLCLLLLCLSLHSCAAIKKQKKQQPQKQGVTYALTVAAIRPANNGETFIKVSFLQSARFYKLAKNADPAYLELLKESLSTHTPVIVSRAKEESDVIVSVAKQVQKK